MFLLDRICKSSSNEKREKGKSATKPQCDEDVILQKKRTWPKVSIVTPSYNQGEFIEDTILSVKNQNYPNIEHIIIDGGSTDNTLELLKKYKGVYNMRWISGPDRGQSDALNKGFNLANGEIIGWINSDDVYFTCNSIRRVVAELRRETDIDIVFGDLAFINDKNEILGMYGYRPFKYDKLLQFRYNLGQPAVIFRKRVLSENKLREDLHYAMDFEFWCRLGRKYRFKHVEDVIAAFRVHANAKSKKHAEKPEKEKRQIVSEYGNILEYNVYIQIGRAHV